MSRKPHEPTDESRKNVETLAAYGTPHEGIAAVIGIDDKTLRKYYREELDTASVKANARGAQSLFKQATEGENVVAAIFWMKVRAGWVEKNALDLGGSLAMKWVDPTDADD